MLTIPESMALLHFRPGVPVGVGLGEQVADRVICIRGRVP